MNWITKLKELHESVEAGEARWYVNDVGVSLDGTLIYEGIGGKPNDLVPVHNYVGLVDDHMGGMIAYGPSEIMEDLADKLNTLHIIEELMHS